MWYWRMLHVCLRRMCILLLLSGMFCIYLLSPSCLMCHRIPFPIPILSTVCVCLHLEWVSDRQHIDRSFFFSLLHSAISCLLVGTFNIFKVITDTYTLNAFLLIVFWSFLEFFFASFFFSSSLPLCFDGFLYCYRKKNIKKGIQANLLQVFWFVVTITFMYHILCR